MERAVGAAIDGLEVTMCFVVTIFVGLVCAAAGFILGHYCGFKEALAETREKTRAILKNLRRD